VRGPHGRAHPDDLAPVVEFVGACAALANPGAFIPLALKAISMLDPSTAEYALL
jgi:hypothetical protein